MARTLSYTPRALRARAAKHTLRAVDLREQAEAYDRLAALEEEFGKPETFAFYRTRSAYLLDLCDSYSRLAASTRVAADRAAAAAKAGV
jgi:hypothetical protein